MSIFGSITVKRFARKVSVRLRECLHNGIRKPFPCNWTVNHELVSRPLQEYVWERPCKRVMVGVHSGTRKQRGKCGCLESYSAVMDHTWNRKILTFHIQIAWRAYIRRYVCLSTVWREMPGEPKSRSQDSGRLGQARHKAEMCCLGAGKITSAILTPDAYLILKKCPQSHCKKSCEIFERFLGLPFRFQADSGEIIPTLYGPPGKFPR